MHSKLFALALATLTTVGTAAAANHNSFGYGEQLDRRTTLRLPIVRAADDGIVNVYRYHRGEKGRLLGSTRVREGANSRVRVYIRTRPFTDVLAELVVNGQVVAAKDFDIDRD
ncbi:MAG: hypothetical protein AAFQ64_01070 [Pseudomonadota bacterium]